MNNFVFGAIFGLIFTVGTVLSILGWTGKQLRDISRLGLFLLFIGIASTVGEAAPEDIWWRILHLRLLLDPLGFVVAAFGLGELLTMDPTGSARDGRKVQLGFGLIAYCLAVIPKIL
jgi:hypothetical protein